MFLALYSQGQNQPPVGVNDTVEVMEQIPILIDVKANDYDPDGDPFWIFDIGLSNSNSATIDIVDDKLWFKSNPEYTYIRPWYQLYDGGNSLSSKTYVYATILPNPNLPVASEDTIELMQLIPQQVDIMVNDYDPNGNDFKIYSVESSYTCAVTVNEDSLSVTVIPQTFGNEYSFWYRIIEKNTGDLFISHNAKVSGNLIPNPDMPVITTDEATATGGIESVIDVLANDYDNQGDPIEVAGFTQPTNGSVTLINNKFYYTPSLSFEGLDAFTYVIREVADTNIYTNYAWVNITVAKNANCPFGISDFANSMTGFEVIIDVMNNDYDNNGDAFEIKDIEGGTKTADNKIKYKSSFFQLNSDTIHYRICETGNPDSYSEWTPVYITLATNPDLPVAVADTIWTKGGIPVSIMPLANDIKNNCDTLIMYYYPSDDPQQKHWGKVDVVKDTFNFLPIYQANGTDRFRYRIRSSTTAHLAMGEIVIICESKFYDSLQISNINAGVNGGSFLFSRYAELPGVGLYYSPPGWENFSSHFEFPKYSRKTTIFNSAIWAGGLDDQNVLHVAAERYKQGPDLGSGIDFQPGPIANHYNTDYLLRYLRTWKVSREEVEYHMNNFWKSGYEPPEAILNWPGNGNTSNGEAAILAPYFDNNSDGQYNCLDGDYPLIRGDETIFLMFNDNITHTESLGNPINLEVHAMVYGFGDPSDTAVYNSVFVHYDLFNRSNATYHNFYFGIFTDTDLGFHDDDYIGCNVANGSFYTYNGKPKDGDGQYWAYGENPPAQSVTILAGPYKDEDQLDNPAVACSESINGLNYGNGIVDDERIGMTGFMYFNNVNAPGPYMTDPTVAEHYYYYLQSKWKDGTPMIYGGNGHTMTGGVGPECKYIFTDDSDPLNWGTNCIQPNGGYNTNGKFWTESEVQNAPGDRRGVASVGPITFRPGQQQEIELAFTVGEASPGIPNSGLNNLFLNLADIQEQVIAGDIITPNNELGINQVNSSNFTFSVYPNPATDFITFNLTSYNNKSTSEFIIFNLYGQVVMKGLINNAQREVLNIAQLNPGLYLIKVFNQNSGKIIKFIKS